MESSCSTAETLILSLASNTNLDYMYYILSVNVLDYVYVSDFELCYVAFEYYKYKNRLNR